MCSVGIHLPNIALSHGLNSFSLVSCRKMLNKYIKIIPIWQKFRIMVWMISVYGTDVTDKSHKNFQEVSDVNWEQLVRREETVPEIEIRC